MKRGRWISWALVLVPLTWGCDSGGRATVEPGSQGGERIAVVRTLVVQPDEVTEVAILAADLLPRRRATLAAEVAGTIEELTVEMGDTVRTGQVLLSIDTRALGQQLAEAEALFRQAQDRYERAERLFERRSITKEQQIDALAARDVAEARLESAELALEKSQVKAPWSGRVAERMVEVGDYAAPGQPVIDLMSVDRLKVQAPASAAEVPYLRVGVPVEVEVDVLPDETFRGEVVRLGAELDPDTRTLDVEAEIDNRDDRLRPGMFGRMRVPLQVLPEALLVPLASVVDFERQKVVYVVADGVAHLRVVELGPVIEERVVVSAGLEAGEHVVIAGQQRIADGQRVSEQETV